MSEQSEQSEQSGQSAERPARRRLAAMPWAGVVTAAGMAGLLAAAGLGAWLFRRMREAEPLPGRAARAAEGGVRRVTRYAQDAYEHRDEVTGMARHGASRARSATSRLTSRIRRG